MNKTKKTIFSGIQPSGNIHLGNYLGAIAQWVEMQDEYNCIFCVVDYHAITLKQNPEELRKKIIETAKIYLAAGIDPKKSIIFQQSDVQEHTELAWVLNCTSVRMSDLNKMTQFKDKVGNKESNIPLGLFDYPVLMASDILLYNTDVVPVGDDQVQHVELTRTLAKRFNQEFSEIFKIPEVKIRKQGSRIMGLDNPENKMSKSADSVSNYIALNDSIEDARKKIMKSITDNDGKVEYDVKNKPGVSNLLTIQSLLTNKKKKDLEKEYIGKGYGDFKKDIADELEKFLTDFQKKFNSISDKEVEEILNEGARRASTMAKDTMKKVKVSIGVK